MSNLNSDGEYNPQNDYNFENVDEQN